MADRLDFEARLAARLQAHAARASRTVDPSLVAATAVATGGARRRGWLAAVWPIRSLAPVAAALLLLGLVLALAAAVVLSGRPRELQSDVTLPPVSPSPVPTSGLTAAPTPIVVADPHALLVVTSKLSPPAPTSCENVDRLGTRDGSSHRVVACAIRFRLTSDGSLAAVAGDRGLTIVDLRDGRVLSTIDTGRYTFPIAWSPSARWIQWESCQGRSSAPCSVVLSARDGSGRHELYQPTSPGYIGFTQWLPDESRVFIPIGCAAEPCAPLVGAADGSNLQPVPSDGLDPVSYPAPPWVIDGAGQAIDIAADGSGYVFLNGAQPRSCCGGYSTASLVDVMLQRLDRGDPLGSPVNLTNDVVGQFVVAAALSPDGRSVAYVRKTIVLPASPLDQRGILSDAPGQLWIRDASGSPRRVGAITLSDIGGRDESFGAVAIHWSPDGTRLAIEAGNGRSGADSSIDTWIVPVDGSVPVVLRDARSVSWSPDGTELALVHQAGPATHLENEPITPATIEVADADGGNRRKVATPTGDLDGFYVMWAAD